MNFNAISQDFPLSNSYSNISPRKVYKEKPHIKIFKEIRNGYNNESPEFFRIDTMNENISSYKNKFLGDVIKEDRNLFYKNTHHTRDQIVNIIDKLKSNKDFSQNPSNLKFVISSLDIDIINKRNQTNFDKKRVNEVKSNDYYDSSKNTTKNNDIGNQIYLEYADKHNFLVKKSIDLKFSNTSNSSIIPNIRPEIDPKKSSYLRNFNDYNIKENYQINKDKHLFFDRNHAKIFNCVSDTEQTTIPDSLIMNRWSSFYDNYHLILNNKKGFSKKGGLFSEFVDKNKHYISMKKSFNNLNINKPVESSEPLHELRKINKPYKKIIIKEKATPLLEKAKDIIKNRNLFKLKNYLISTGAINNIGN